MKKKGKIFILSGPSGSGKTTLYQRLLSETRELEKTISVTTRPKRRGEKHGRDYYFVSPKMFQYKQRAGHFLESEKVFGNSYGTPKAMVKKILARGKNVLMAIDVKGAKKVCRQYPEAVSIFIKTPSLADLKKRLEKRGSEDKDTLQSRVKVAKKELAEAKNYDHVVVNDNIHRAYGQFVGIVSGVLKK